MYAATADPYCYPGTTILKNRLNLKDQAALDAFETDLVTQRLAEPLPAGRFSVRHYCAIHRHLFGDVYPWAGRLRRVRIARSDSMFCYPENIASELRRIFSELRWAGYLVDRTKRAFAQDAAHVLAELNAVHAFRDGNGRVQLAFMALLSNRAGHTLDLTRLDPEPFLTAMIASFRGNERPLLRNLLNLLASAPRQPNRLSR